MRNAIGRIIAALAICAVARTATACTCRQTPDFKLAVGSSTEIFLAEVLDIKQLPYEGQEVSVQVHAAWKGAITGRNIVHGGGACGFYFKRGEQYLIYSRSVDGKVSVSMCSRSKDYSRATDDIRSLGAPRWVSSPNLALTPKTSSGLSVSIAPAKSKFSQWDDIGFDVTFLNQAANSISLPNKNSAPNLIELVVHRNGQWWTTVSGLTSRKDPNNAWPTSLLSGESKTARIDAWEARRPLQINTILREPGKYSVTAVMHFSTSTSGLWTGYLFSEPVELSLYRKEESDGTSGTPN